MSNRVLSHIKSLRFILVTTWIARIIVGVVFITSGMAKLLDLWGTVFKIEDYAAVWGIEVPRTVIMVSALSLATFEFTAGSLLITGCYRRVVSWLLALCMAFMLPLTAYIWYADPVADCGCFGDLIVISNSATFFKNVVLAIFIIILLKYNLKARYLYNPSIQWVVVVILVLYSLTIALIGYNVQPLVDFRPYKVGQELLDDSNNDSAVQFVYANRDGMEKSFNIDDLPEDDEWKFVKRIDSGMSKKNLTLYDPETGDDVTEEYLTDADSLLILVLPEPSRADLSNTYAINELYEKAIESPSTGVVALLATDAQGINRWKDHSMASYPCLQVDDTQLKQLSRGVMSMVWVTMDTIRWKRTVSSIRNEDLKMIASGNGSFNSLEFDGERYFINISLVMLSVLVVVYLLQTMIISFFNRFHSIRS